MLADVRHFAKERIQAGFGTGFAESRLMHTRRTGCYNNTIQLMFLYGFLQQGLARVGTHIFIVGGEFNTFQFTGYFGYFFAIYSG